MTGTGIAAEQHCRRRAGRKLSIFRAGGCVSFGRHNRRSHEAPFPPENSSMSRGATLQSLATELKIHVSTVSRVLNGSDADAKSAASSDKIELIRALARMRNYQPNLHAVGLRTSKSKIINVFIPSISDIVGALIYEGVDDAARRLGYLPLISDTHDELERQDSHLASAIARKVDGMIFADAQPARVHLIKEVQRRGIPYLLVHRKLGPDVCSVTVDDFKGGELAAKHLVDQGHTKFAVLAGLPYASTGAGRAAGFVAHCASRGIEVPGNRILHSGFDLASGRVAGEFLCSSGDIPTAVFAADDFLAIGLMGAVRDKGLIAGDDIAIVGYNDTPVAAELSIPLSSVRSPMHQMGSRGMELLFEAMQGREIQSEILPPKLIIRQSSWSI